MFVCHSFFPVFDAYELVYFYFPFIPDGFF